MSDIDKERFIEKIEYYLFNHKIFEKIRYFDCSNYTDYKNNLSTENLIFKK